MTVLCFAVRNRTALVFVTAFSGVGLIPIALQGHAAEAAGHDIAVTSLGLHLVFVAAWLGGLLTIVLIRGSLVKDRIGPVIGAQFHPEKSQRAGIELLDAFARWAP